MGGLFQINPVTKTGQRLYMVHMLLLPFLPITALIIQNSTTLNELLQYQTEVQRIGEKVQFSVAKATLETALFVCSSVRPYVRHTILKVL